MRNRVRNRRVVLQSAIAMFLVTTVVVTLAAPIGMQSAEAQNQPAFETRVQILHASPDLGKVEVHINYDEVVDEFEYGDMSDWITIDPGSNRFTITYDRAGFNYAAFDVVYPVPAGNDYYVIISDAIVMSSVVDRTPVSGGGARLRVDQAAVDLPAVNVEATTGNVSFATELAYPRSSDYVSVPAGTYDVEVTVAGTGESILTMPGMVFDDNMVYELVIMGEPGDDDKPLEIRTLVDTTVGTTEATPAATPAA